MCEQLLLNSSYRAGRPETILVDEEEVTWHGVGRQAGRVPPCAHHPTFLDPFLLLQAKADACIASSPSAMPCHPLIHPSHVSSARS